MRVVRRAVSVMASVITLMACGFWRPTVIPMAQSFYSAPCTSVDGHARPLLVLLPGRFMYPEEFIREGYLRAVRERGFALDVLIVDAHLGYYSDRSILERLRVDVFEPARKRGVREIWVAGISVGAFGAMLYADANPGEIAGLIAIGPYLGSGKVSDAIRAANGLPQWHAPEPLPPLTVDSSDIEAELHLWQWLKEQTASSSKPNANPNLYLIFGRNDRFKNAQEVMADSLPPSHVVMIDGAHNWDAWRPAWRQLLDRLPIERRSECKASDLTK